MAHHGAKGTSKLGRDSVSKRLGIKRFAGQKVKAGEVLVRQRGTKYHPGKNVRKGRDDTLYAAKTGILQFQTTKKRKFDNRRKLVKFLHVV